MSICPDCGAEFESKGRPHPQFECIAYLRQRLTALTLRVEALEEREIGDLTEPVVPMLPPGGWF